MQSPQRFQCLCLDDYLMLRLVVRESVSGSESRSGGGGEARGKGGSRKVAKRKRS